MKRRSFAVTIFLVCALLLSNCSLSATPINVNATTTVPNSVATELAGTVDAHFAIQTAVVQTLQAHSSSQTAQAPTATAPPVLTATLTPASTLLPTNTPVPPTAGIPIPDTGSVCDQAAFVQDVTIPDGSTLTAESGFTKIWRLMNTGTCTWTTAYRVVFNRGFNFSGVSSFNLPANVLPGQTVDISLGMTAPTAPGFYAGYWMLMDPNGTQFGVGTGSGVPFFVRINVAGTPFVFAVTSITMSIDTRTSTTSCPPGHTFTFTGNIVTNGAGTVTYHWEFSNLSNSSTRSLDFDSAGVQTVSITWRPGDSGHLATNPYHGWARIYIDSPNHQFFGRDNFTLTCSP